MIPFILLESFIQRWGTHYVKAAKFGGQLEIRKTMDAKEVQSKSDFSRTMEIEYKSFFAGFSHKESYKEGTSAKSQARTSSTSLSVQGGSQDIAAIMSDAYSPTIKNELKEWLDSIPTYPKAFSFTLASISDLVNFRAHDLFVDENVDWGCEVHKNNLVTDPDTKESYYEVKVNGTTVRKNCHYLNREALMNDLKQRRQNLEKAISVYIEEVRK